MEYPLRSFKQSQTEWRRRSSSKTKSLLWKLAVKFVYNFCVYGVVVNLLYIATPAARNTTPWFLSSLLRVESACTHDCSRLWKLLINKNQRFYLFYLYHRRLLHRPTESSTAVKYWLKEWCRLRLRRRLRAYFSNSCSMSSNDKKKIIFMN